MIALLLGLIYLGMSTIVQLRHTDDLSWLQSFAGGHAAIGHQTHSAPDQDCIAHKWSDAAQMLCAVTPPTADAVFIRIQSPPAVRSALHLSAFRYTELRAPPSAA